MFSLLASIGACVVVKNFLHCVMWSKQYLHRPNRNFIKEYGNDWVLITGSSRGIGKSFGKEFAKRNMNILLTARKEEDLIKTSNELKKINQNIKVEYIVCDFNKDFLSFKNIFSNYEFSVLINNVGTVSLDFLEKIDDKEIDRMINVNIKASTYLTKIVIEKMKKRKKSLIVTIGSDCALYKPPFIQVYNATKSYLECFISSLSKENENIDFTYLCPGAVDTEMNRKNIPYKISSDIFVQRSIPQLGRYLNSHGHFKHSLKYLIYGNYFVYNIFTKKDLKMEFYPK